MADCNCIIISTFVTGTVIRTSFAGVQGKRQSADAILNSIIYPVGSRPDDSPLFMLCMNDTCSFTWTGDEHINQVLIIFLIKSKLVILVPKYPRKHTVLSALSPDIFSFIKLFCL